MGLHLEVKRYQRIAACRFIEQAERDALENAEVLRSMGGRPQEGGDIPVVLMREDGGPWMVLVPLDRSLEFAQCLVQE